MGGYSRVPLFLLLVAWSAKEKKNAYKMLFSRVEDGKKVNKT